MKRRTMLVLGILTATLLILTACPNPTGGSSDNDPTANENGEDDNGATPGDTGETGTGDNDDGTGDDDDGTGDDDGGSGDSGGNADYDGPLVTSSADSGPGSLRQAVADAEPGEEIRFLEDMTITLTGDRRGIEIDKHIIINGINTSVVITTEGAQRHFTHMPGGPYTLTVANMTLRDGEPRKGGLLPGGSIYVGGGSTATIENVSFEANLGTNGGAIFVEAAGGTATLNVIDSTFNENESRGIGTAVANPAGSGGAMYAFDTDLVVEGRVFEENVTNNGNAQLEDSTSGQGR